MCKAVPVGEACQVPGDCTSNKCEDDGSGNNTNVCKGTYLSISLPTENDVFVRSLQSISPAVVLDVTLLRTHRVHIRAYVLFLSFFMIKSTSPFLVRTRVSQAI